jgi:hypothetical protein
LQTHDNLVDDGTTIVILTLNVDTGRMCFPDNVHIHAFQYDSVVTAGLRLRLSYPKVAKLLLATILWWAIAVRHLAVCARPTIIFDVAEPRGQYRILMTRFCAAQTSCLLVRLFGLLRTRLVLSPTATLDRHPRQLTRLSVHDGFCS